MSKNGMDDFTKLSSIISMYRPSNSSRKIGADEASPGLIVICSWMGASVQKHVVKYANEYRRICPQASILLIESVLHAMFIGSDLKPAHEAIEAFMNTCTSTTSSGSSEMPPPILLHAFSNGGANNTIWLAQGLKKKYGRLPIQWLVLDSCPGRFEVASTTLAISLSIPNYYFARTLGWYMIYAWLSVHKIIGSALRTQDTISWIRRNMNDPELFPLTLPRLYMTSRADKMVDWQDVSAHWEEARQLGYETVRGVLFQKAPHCALINENYEKYWGAVRALIDGVEE